MRLSTWCVVVGLAFGVVACAAETLPTGDKKKYVDPTPRKEQILKLFVKEFVTLTPGKGKFPASFTMGSKSAASEQPAHTVRLRSPFAMAKYEVTQELYHVAMGNNPSKWKGPRNSVEVTSWDDANEFCRKVTMALRKRKLIRANEIIRLPTEAEWEYACRAGTKTAWSFGGDVKDLTDYAWYKKNSKGEDPPVGVKKPNPWGLYDMHGYIWEWCADDWQPSYKGAPANGSAVTKAGAKNRVVRGGSWADMAEACRSAYRGQRTRDFRDDKVGFRCVRAEK